MQERCEGCGQSNFVIYAALFEYRIRCVSGLASFIDGDISVSDRTTPNFVITRTFTNEITIITPKNFNNLPVKSFGHQSM